ncbi:MAG: hypothetical protein ACKVT1_18835, partial [Dehalococcoidia bacterium]
LVASAWFEVSSLVVGCWRSVGGALLSTGKHQQSEINIYVVYVNIPVDSRDRVAANFRLCQPLALGRCLASKCR